MGGCDLWVGVGRVGFVGNVCMGVHGVCGWVWRLWWSCEGVWEVFVDFVGGVQFVVHNPHHQQLSRSRWWSLGALVAVAGRAPSSVHLWLCPRACICWHRTGLTC